MEQILYKKKYSLGQFYPILVAGLRTLPTFIRAKKANIISERFIKRIMLAVTEVNGCAVCSYAHTESALKLGMDEAEIKQLLTGVYNDMPEKEAKAIMFSQHYAHAEGNPTQAAWDGFLASYSEKEALAIVSAIRTIMVGNSYGLAVSAWKDRRGGQPIEGSSVFSELTMIIGGITFIPFAALQAIIETIFRKRILPL